MIKWFNVKDRNGVASFYANNITLNTTAMYPLDTAYKVQVGMDDKNNVVIQPLTKEVVSFARISSVQLLKQISEALRIPFTNKPTQFETTWDSVENVLTIKTGEK